MQPLPNQSSPFVNNQTGTIVPPWNSYLQQFTQAPPKFIAITVGVSPFSYKAKEPGYISIADGVVSAIALIRGIVNIDVTGVKLIPVSIEDIVKVTYTGLPTIKFIPIYGAAIK